MLSKEVNAPAVTSADSPTHRVMELKPVVTPRTDPVEEDMIEIDLADTDSTITSLAFALHSKEESASVATAADTAILLVDLAAPPATAVVPAPPVFATPSSVASARTVTAADTAMTPTPAPVVFALPSSVVNAPVARLADTVTMPLMLPLLLLTSSKGLGAIATFQHF